MARAIDQKIVQMKMDDSDFTSKVKSVLSKFTELNSGFNKLNNANVSGAANGIGAIGTKAGISASEMSKMASSVDFVASKFTVLGQIGQAAIANITNRMIDMSSRVLKGATIQPLIDGYNEYTNKLKSINVIMNNVPGAKLVDVKNTLAGLNKYADQTIYSFEDMTSNMGTFTAAGVGLEDSATAIQGIGNLAASSGSNTQQMSMAMYQLSQALAAGKVGLQDWNSVVNAGMGGQKFQKALSATAKELGHGRNEAVSFRDSLQDGWLTSEVLLKTLAKFKDDKSMQKAATQVKSFGDLVDTTAEGLGSAWAQVWENILGDSSEAPKLWTGVANAIQKPIQAMDNYNKSTSKAFHDLGGRDAIIGALTNLFSSLAKILGTVAKAFGEIFPPATGKQLTDMAKGFQKFTEGLKVSDGTLRNIHDIFKAFFNTIKIGINIVKMVAGALLGLIPKGLSGGILQLLGDFARFILKLEESKTAAKAFSLVTEVLTKAINSVKDAVKDAGKFFGSFREVLSVLGDVAIKAFNKIKSGLSSMMTSLKGSTKGQSLDLSTILGIGGMVGVMVFVKKLKGVFKTLEETIKGGGPLKGMVKTFKSTLNGMTDALNAMTGSVKADTLVKISGAILGLAVAMKVLASINAKDVFKSLEILALMLFGMTKTLDVLGSMKGSVMRATVASYALVGLAAAVGIVAAAVWAFSKINPENFAQAMFGVAGTMLVLVAAMNGLSTVSPRATVAAAGIVLLSAAIDMIALAVIALGLIPMNAAIQGVAAISSILFVLGAFVNIVDKAKFGMGTAVSIVLLSGAIVVMSGAVAALGYLPFDVIVQGLTAMATLLLEIGVFALIANGVKMGTTAVQMVILSAALTIISGVLLVLGKTPWKQLATGFVALAGVIILMAGAMVVMQGSLAGAAAMAIMAASMNLLVVPLLAFSKMSLPELAIGLGAMAGSLAILIAAGFGAQLVSVGLLALGASMLLIGAGAALAGVGLAAFATGLVALIGVGVVGVNSLISVLAALLDGIITLAPKIAIAFTAIIAAILQAIVTNIPAIINAFLQLVQGILDAILTNGPQIVNTFLQIIIQLVQVVTDNVPQLVQVFVDFIVAVAGAIGANAYTIIDAGINLIINLINGMANAIRDNQDQIVSAMMNALEAMLEVVITVLQKVLTALFGWIPGFSGMMSSAGSQAKDALRDAFGIDETAKGKAQGAVDGVASKSGAMNGAGQKLAKSGVSGLSTMNANGKGSEKGQDFANGIGGKSGSVNGAGSKLSKSGVAGANTGNFNRTGSTKGSDFAGGIRGKGGEANGAGSHLASRAKSGAGSKSLEGVGSDAGSGFARGISSVGGAVWNAAAGLARKAMEAIKKTQNSHSPSKETSKLGSYFGQGYTNGIDDQASNVVSSAQSMVSAALGVVAQSGKDINQALEDNLNLQPTITPVIDGSGMSYAGSFGATLEPVGGYFYGQNSQNGQQVQTIKIDTSGLDAKLDEFVEKVNNGANINIDNIYGSLDEVTARKWATVLSVALAKQK